jgi:SWI/SNF-related matrix-associated actin-dependent regulator of chromatin subfamily A-like protein 1
LLNILDPIEYPSYFDFCNQYAYAEESFGETIYKGARNLDHLHDRLKGRLPDVRGCLIRRRKEDVLADLPPIRYETVPIEVDLREYRTAEINFLLWLENEYNNEKPGERITKQRSRLGYLKRLAARLKMKNALVWIGDFLESGDKLLLGVVHYFVSGAIMDRFEDRAVLVDGRLSDRDKHAGFNRFNTDPSCELMVGNVLSAGSSWSCTSTSDSALLEMPWRPCDLEQFASRIHGIGRGVADRGAHLRLLIGGGYRRDYSKKA